MKKFLIFWIQLFLFSSALAQLSPGDLAKPHNPLEGIKNCTKCHELGKKILPAKCLDCHVLLKDLIQAGKGLHAKSEYSHCPDCHSDHQGKEYDLIWWKEGKEKFGLEFEGKNLDNFASALSAKVLKEANINPDKKVAELETSLNRLQSNYLQSHNIQDHSCNLQSLALTVHSNMRLVKTKSLK